MDPAYDECGEICGDTQEPCAGFCDGCPMKTVQDAFVEECIDWLNARAADQWQQYGFDLLLQTVLDIFKYEKLPQSHVSAKIGKLISIKQSEEIRKKRIDRWNKNLENPENE
jgi:hypothetical protein